MKKSEISILKHLSDKKIQNQIQSLSIRRISLATNLNYFNTRNIINRLVALHYLKFGFKEGNANTYYISQKGLDYLSEIKKE